MSNVKKRRYDEETKDANQLQIILLVLSVPNDVIDIIQRYHYVSFVRTIRNINYKIRKRYHKHKRVWFVCDWCNWLCQGHAKYCPTDGRSEDRPFCDDCVQTCEACDQYYAPYREREHDSCRIDADPYEEV